MSLLLYLGLLIAFAAAPLLLALSKLLRFNSGSPLSRLTLWAAAIVVLVISATGTNAWQVYLGFERLTWRSFFLGVLAAIILLLTFAVYQYVQMTLAPESPKKLQLGQKIMDLPFSHRLFLVATAAVVEEVLYRGYAIGIGQFLLGSVWLAGVVSVAAFTLVHIRWGLAHLLPVFVGAIIFSLLFVFTQNLWACIIAHAIVDAMAFLVLPAIMLRKHQASVPRGD